MVLLVKCYRDFEFVPDYLKVSKPITQLIVLGLVLMTLSGVTWLVLGYGVTTMLIVKLILVGVMWVLGPVIDNFIEPKFHAAAHSSGGTPSLAFTQVQKQHLAIESIATIIFYVIMVLGVLL
jgi:Na+-transporting methylmalonyl-CoA/oxaloacetate decarboxylase gamma subunit